MYVYVYRYTGTHSTAQGGLPLILSLPIVCEYGHMPTLNTVVVHVLIDWPRSRDARMYPSPLPVSRPSLWFGGAYTARLHLHDPCFHFLAVAQWLFLWPSLRSLRSTGAMPSLCYTKYRKPPYRTMPEWWPRRSAALGRLAWEWDLGNEPWLAHEISWIFFCCTQPLSTSTLIALAPWRGHDRTTSDSLALSYTQCTFLLITSRVYL